MVRSLSDTKLYSDSTDLTRKIGERKYEIVHIDRLLQSRLSSSIVRQHMCEVHVCSKQHESFLVQPSRIAAESVPHLCLLSHAFATAFSFANLNFFTHPPLAIKCEPLHVRA